MHQLARLAGGGDVVVPAAGDVGFGVEAEDALADGVAMVVIVEEPAVVAGVTEGRLNRVQVHRGHSSAWIKGPAIEFTTRHSRIDIR